MKKRIICLLLSLLLLVPALPVRAADGAELTVSDALLEMIKGFEGFSATQVYEGGRTFIGYGCLCEPGEYPNGITEAQATELLRRTAGECGEYILRCTASWGVSLSQCQFDALVSMTYNLGVSWINSSYRFWSMLREGLDGYSTNEIASALGVWCHIGTTVSTYVLQRRIREARLFLYGDYTGESSPDFCWLILSGNGGTVDTDVMLYQIHEKYQTFPAAARSGWYFAGWYTDPEGGEQVTAYDTVTASRAVYAHWSETPVQEPVEPGRFTDVREDDWFFGYVTGLAEAGVIGGFGDGSYRPQEFVTVGQALKLVLLAVGEAPCEGTVDHWAGGYRDLALERGYVDAEALADLDAPAGRAMLAELAANALGLVRADPDPVFADTDDDASAALYHAGIIDGSIDAATGDRLYHPEQNATRAEMAKIVWMLYEYRT